MLVALWTASSSVDALIEAMDVAFEVPRIRSWWHRRLIAIALTLGFVVLLAAALVFLFASSEVAQVINERLPILGSLGRLSNVVRWLVALLLLLLSMTLIYGFGPNLDRKRWEGVLPGACFALVCWSGSLLGLKDLFNDLRVAKPVVWIACRGGGAPLWLYLSAAAIVLGGELNAIICHAFGKRNDQYARGPPWNSLNARCARPSTAPAVGK